MDAQQMRTLAVRKGNPLIQKSKYDLTPQQYDLLTFCVSLVKPTDRQGTRYNFEIADFCRVMGIQHRNGQNYINIKQALDAIDNMKIWVYEKETKTRIRTRWFDTLRINEGDGTITFSFHETVGEWVYLQASNFTHYIAENVYALKGKYAKYLYDFCHSYMNQGNITIKIEALAEVCPHPYTEYKEIKRRVLEAAVAEINELTDITIAYEPIKQNSRKTTHIQFTIKKVNKGEAAVRSIRRKEALGEEWQPAAHDDLPY